MSGTGLFGNTTAKGYHDRTSYDRHKLSGHALDWYNQPEVFKSYPDRPKVELPRVRDWADRPLSQLVHGLPGSAAGVRLDLQALARILMLTESITAQTRHAGTDFFYRSVASAGALYPFELYVAALDVEGLDPGVYHYDLPSLSLVCLRSGNALSDISDAVAGVSDSPVPAAVFFLTSIFFRSSWKYRDRAYRYHLLDTGHMAENLALALKHAGLGLSIHYDFQDPAANKLLALDETLEACLAVVPAWDSAERSIQAADQLAPASADLLAASRVAGREVDYPLIHEIHLACAHIPSPEAVSRLCRPTGLTSPQETVSWADSVTWPETVAYPAVVLKRRSMRNFVTRDLASEQLTGLLDALSPDPAVEAEAEPFGRTALRVGLLTGNVAGLDPGFHWLHREDRSLRTVSGGRYIEEMTVICLDQAWLSHCAIHFLFVADLESIEEACGPRGYRHVMLRAGRLGQRLYLAATAMRLGCCGIGAFYDSEARRLLGLDSGGRLLYLMAVGPVRKLVGG